MMITAVQWWGGWWYLGTCDCDGDDYENVGDDHDADHNHDVNSDEEGDDNCDCDVDDYDNDPALHRDNNDKDQDD